jgi:aminoglycoside phosphotransferase (APT) family kinase protein
MTVVADRPAATGLEAAVSGLRHALDTGAMRGGLGRMLWPDGGGAVERVAVGKLLYRDDGACSLRYTASVRDAWERGREVSVGARVLADAEAAEAFRCGLEPIARAAAGHPLLRGLAAALASDPAVPMTVHVFPIEPELPGLPAATDPARAGELLAAALGRAHAEPCRVEVAHHPREGRCTLRYRAAGGGTVYAKIAGRVSGEPTAALRALAAKAPGLRVPQPLGTVPELGLSLQSDVTGTPCAEALLRAARPGQSAAALDACARAAAAVHACPVAIAGVRSAETDAARLRRDLDLVRRVAADLADDLGGCIDRALFAAGAAGPGPAGLCHGDLTHRQIVLEGDAPGLVDFDDACMGEAGLDLGHFCAYLRLAARRAAETSAGDAGEPMCRRFLCAYAAEARLGGPERRRLARRAAVHEALALVHVAISSWRHGKPARLARARSLLEEGGMWPRR